ncbi:hypothetical protein, partial [Ornithobacterium rhinotracheale]
ALDFFVSHTLAPSLRKTLGQAKMNKKENTSTIQNPKELLFYIFFTAVKLCYFQQKSLTMALGAYHSKAKT